MSAPIRPNRNQQLLLPPSLDEWVSSDHPVRFVRDLVDTLDLERLGFTTAGSEDEPGRPAYAPEIMLAVWLFGWMERVRSSRALEKACRRDVAYLWLTGNLHPDHNSLWRFFRRHREAFPKLFKQVVRVGVEAGLVGFVLHALDGTKIKTASSTATALHRKHLTDLLKRLDETIAESMKDIDASEQREDASYAMPADLLDAQKRREMIRQQLALLDQEGVDHLHLKEPEAKVCKVGAEKVLAFNAQAVVDRKSDLIVAIDVVPDQSDNALLGPMLQQVEETAGANAEDTVADGGYFSGPQLDAAAKQEASVVVCPTDPDDLHGEYGKARFRYDPQADVYVCPRGELLPLRTTKAPMANRPFRLFIYQCHNTDCPVRGQCTKSPSGREINRSEHDDVLDQARSRYASSDGQRLYRKRKEIVEHLFGIAKWNHGFRRFTARGRKSAHAQWALLCSAINLNKLYAAWLDGDLQLA